MVTTIKDDHSLIRMDERAHGTGEEEKNNVNKQVQIAETQKSENDPLKPEMIKIEGNTIISSNDEESEAGEMDIPPTEIMNGTNTKPASKLLCSVCNKKIGMRSCPSLACINCCSDMQCPAHLARRQSKKQEEELLEGKNEVNKLASEIRSRAIPSGTYRETRIKYIGETLVLWNQNEFLKNPKWRKDAFRKAKKQRILFTSAEDVLQPHSKSVINKPKIHHKDKFNQVLNELYENSLEKTS